MHTISQLLHTAGCHFHVYEMGRQIRPITKQTFAQIETLTHPYPAPIRGKAWFAIEFFEQQPSAEPFIWFVHFSVDEFGLLHADQLNHFIKIIADQALHTLASNAGQPNDNPYTFKPSQDKLAALNSLIRFRRHAKASSHLQGAMDYYLQATPQQPWQTLGIQGIADLATRSGQKAVEASLCDNFAHWQLEAKIALLNQLEHHTIGRKLASVIAQTLTQETHPTCREAMIRALSGAPEAIGNDVLAALLTGEETPSVSDLIAIVGRHWHRLHQTTWAKALLEQLAKQTFDTDEVFQAVMVDMLALPNVREQVIVLMRDPTISDRLRGAIGRFISHQTNHSS